MKGSDDPATPRAAVTSLTDADEEIVRGEALVHILKNVSPLRFVLVPMMLASVAVAGRYFHPERSAALIAWAVLASLVTVVAVEVPKRRHRLPSPWLTGCALAVVGMTPGSFTWLALPDEPVVAMFIIVVPCISLAVGAVAAAGRWSMYLAHTIPLGIVATTGMWASDTAFVRSLVVLFWVLAIAMGSLHYEVSQSLLSSLRHKRAGMRLTEQLAAEQAALSDAYATLRTTNEQLEFLALHDPLTGLLNRRGALDALDHLLAAADRPVGVLFIDLDRFKAVNDLLGHRGGDQFLNTLADRVGRTLGPDSFAGRIGGDEFVVVLADHDVGRATAVAGRLVDVLGQPVHAEGRAMPSSVSIGVAASPLHGTTASDLLRNANTALFSAKREGRNRLQVFDGEMQEELLRTSAAEQSLRRAIDSGDILPFFQPEIDATTGRVIGAELLARWVHPDGTIADAMEFIDIARRAGLLERLTEQVLNRARPDIRRLASVGLPDGFRFRVNLAPASTDRAWRYGAIEELVRGIDPNLLTVDVREAALVNDLPTAAAKLASFRALGGRVCLEDFARGVSSLSMLRKVPIDEVRIDRSAIDTITTHPHDRAIVRSVIGLVRDLGLSVTAEGIETGAQADTLIALGCVRQQGFLYAPALATEQFETFLIRRQADTFDRQEAVDTWIIENLG
jgi:diguanylate cyclase (GGDEF)-like protein